MDLDGATPADHVMIGSLTKLVTGLAVGKLIQDGKLTLQTRLGDVLTSYFVAHGKPLDPSLRDITIERLLTHTAGLRTNYTSDPVRGIKNSDVFSRLGPDSTAFDYLIEARADVSNGETRHVYSNISYLLLGLVVEAVSGESYEGFCKQHVFAALGIADAVIPGPYQVVAPFAGWRMAPGELSRLLGAFDVNRPSLLTRDTLRRILLTDLGPPLGRDGNVHYTIGVYVKKSSDGTAYLLSHNGIADFFKDEPTYFSFVEARFPGTKWSFFTSPSPVADDRQKLVTDIRHAVAEVSTK
ncbi:serine hydrolase domain-containing protein [Paraburkholderia sp. MM6662-R1]|uniref:serine hydrolase domain-containing protein n=1 Tax=Paraburkholderia sp. MM6662-R1 TaxID=2991066 RepID=UPI003D221458